jgi:glycosyltransferase involved in cell wall biosynthesis
VISTFGFLLPHKGILELIQAVGILRRTMPDVLLLAVCSIHPDGSSAWYRDECRAEVKRLGLEESVVLVTDFLPEAQAQALLAASDLIVLPYKETEESQSAALRFVLPVGRPILAPDIAIFADAREALVLVPDASPAGLAAAIANLISDPDSLDQLAERAAAFARRISWTSIASRYQRLYAELSTSVPR